MTKTTRRRALSAAVWVAVLAGAGMTACSNAPDDSASGGAGEPNTQPIKIGAVSSLTGPAPFPDVPAAAQAVFDRVNASGGIQGRQIEYLLEDDGANPAQANQVATRLIDEEGVVAMAGAASLVECSANAALYQQRGIVEVSGTGVEPTCFTSANIAPVNNGTISGYASLLYFASETLDNDRVCPVILNSAGLTEPYLALIDRWEADTGHTAPHVDTSVNLGDDPTAAILATRDAGCDAVVFNSNEPVAVAFMQTVKRQGLLETADWLTLTSAYTQTAYDALQAQDTLGLYANSEFLPFTSDDPALDGWRTALTDAGAQLTSLSEGGYVAAEILVEVLRSIDGEITRDSVTAAFRTLDEIDNPLMGMPFTFGDNTAHNPNRASMMVQAGQDGWETVSDWVEVPTAATNG